MSDVARWLIGVCVGLVGIVVWGSLVGWGRVVGHLVSVVVSGKRGFEKGRVGLVRAF